MSLPAGTTVINGFALSPDGALYVTPSGTANITGGTAAFTETQTGTAASSISGTASSLGTFSPVGATQYAYFGGIWKATYTGAGGITGVGHLGGVLGWAVNNSPGVTSSLVVGAEGKIDNTAGTITDARCVEAQVSANPVGQTITTLRGVNSEVTSNAGTITTFYGYYAAGNGNTGTIGTYTAFAATRPDGTVNGINGYLFPDMTATSGNTIAISSSLAAGTNKFFIFSSGTAPSFHGGTWQIGGSLIRATPATKTANYTVTSADSYLIMNGAGSLTLTLEAAASFPGRELYVRTIAAQTVVSASSNVVPLAGGAAGTAILAATAGKWALLVSDGTNWQIMAGA